MGISHAAILANRPDVELVGCVDPSGAALELARGIGVDAPLLHSTASLFRASIPDVAFLCLPSVLNLRVTRECVDRRVNVFVEKPLAHTIDEASEMVRLAEANRGLRFGVGFMGAHIATFSHARELIATNAIGPIREANCSIEQSLVSTRQRSWVFRRATAGGGAAMSLASHGILQILRLAGPVVAVEESAQRYTSGNEVEDSGRARLRLDNGAHVDLSYDWSASDRPQMTVALEIRGDSGLIRVNEAWFELERNGERTATHISKLPDRARLYLGGDGYALEDDDFITAVRDHAQPRVTWQEGLNVQRIIDALYQRADSAAEVAVG